VAWHSRFKSLNEYLVPEGWTCYQCSWVVTSPHYLWILNTGRDHIVCTEHQWTRPVYKGAQKHPWTRMLWSTRGVSLWTRVLGTHNPLTFTAMSVGCVHGLQTWVSSEHGPSTGVLKSTLEHGCFGAPMVYDCGHGCSVHTTREGSRPCLWAVFMACNHGCP